MSMSVVATRRSSWSPSPWPRLSFTVLKSSRSRNRTARWESVRVIRVRACSRRSWKSALLASRVKRVVEGPVGQLVLEHLAVGDVAEAVDPPDDLCRRRVGAREKHSTTRPSLNSKQVRRLALRRRVSNSCSPAHEILGLGQAGRWRSAEVADVVLPGDRVLGRCARCPGSGWLKSVILPLVVDHQDPVGGGVQRGGEPGEGLAELVLGGHLGRDVVRRDDDPLDGRVVQQVDEVQLEGDDAAVVAAEVHPCLHRVGRRGAASSRGTERGVELAAVALGDDVRRAGVPRGARGRARAAG